MNNYLMCPIRAVFLLLGLLAPQILWAGYSQEEPMDVVRTPSKPVSTAVKKENSQSKSKRKLKSKVTLKPKRNLKRKFSHSDDASLIKKKQKVREEKNATPHSTPFSLRLSTQSPEQLRGARTVTDPVGGECVNAAPSIATHSDGSQMELSVKKEWNTNSSAERPLMRLCTFSPDFFMGTVTAQDSPEFTFSQLFHCWGSSPDGAKMVICDDGGQNSVPLSQPQSLRLIHLPPEIFIGVRTVYDPYGGVFEKESPCILSYLSTEELGQLALACPLMWVYVKDFMRKQGGLCLELGPENMERFLNAHVPLHSDLIQQFTNLFQKETAPPRIRSFSFTDPKTFRRIAGHLTLGMRQFAVFNSLGTEENQISPAGVRDLVVAISEVGLKKLALANHPSLEASAINELLGALPEGLVELKLSGLDMGADTIGVLAGVVSNLPLVLLDISESMVYGAGIISLAEALPDTLEILNIAHSQEINTAGMWAVGKAVRSNRKIKELHLSGNGLDEVGLVGLISILSQTGIQHLDLSHNFLEDAGANALLKVLLLSQIVVLKIKDNDIGPEVKARFRRIRNANQELIQVEV